MHSLAFHKSSRAERVLRTKQRRHGWRSAPVFASGHRPAPRKSAKRKSFGAHAPCICTFLANGSAFLTSQIHPSPAGCWERGGGSVLPGLLGFQTLFFGDVGLHLGDGPALHVGLAAPFDGQGPGGHVLGDGAAGGGVGAVPHRHRRHQVGVAADEAVIPDGGAVLVLAVVVAGDGAAAEVAVFAHVAVPDVGQVADGVAPGKAGVLGLHVGPQMDAVVGGGARPHMGEGPDVVVGADLGCVDLAGV